MVSEDEEKAVFSLVMCCLSRPSPPCSLGTAVQSTTFINILCRNGGPVPGVYQYFVQERWASPRSLSIFSAGTVGQSPEFNNILCRNSQPGPGVYQYFVQERWASPRSLSIFCAGTVGQSPEFIGSIANVTISQGRDASFACSVKNLGGFKVVRG